MVVVKPAGASREQLAAQLLPASRQLARQAAQLGLTAEEALEVFCTALKEKPQSPKP
jgi:hypothetical protein